MRLSSCDMAHAGADGAVVNLPLADRSGESGGRPPYQPGTKLLVSFVGYPGVWHERLVLYPATTSSCAITRTQAYRQLPPMLSAAQASGWPFLIVACGIAS